MISGGIIFLDVFLGVLGLVMALGFIAVNDSRRKRYKLMKVKTIGKIITTESEYNMNTNWRLDENQSMKRLEDRMAKYVFSVNGVEYRGNGECSLFKFTGSTVKVFYNPDNPNENCTAYQKRWQTGNGEALATIAIIGVIIIVPILLKLFVN